VCVCVCVFVWVGVSVKVSSCVSVGMHVSLQRTITTSRLRAKQPWIVHSGTFALGLLAVLPENITHAKLSSDIWCIFRVAHFHFCM